MSYIVEAPRFSLVAILRQPKLLRTEVLAGLVVALALIPEAISFSIIAEVDPRLGLYASFTMAITISITGGRPAMISAATGAIALVVAPVVKKYGVDYLLATVILAGLIQMAMGFLGVAKVMRFIPRSVMIGFVNSLAVLIFMAQIPELMNVSWAVYPMVAAGLIILVMLPRFFTVIPAPLIAIVVLTLVMRLFSVDVPSVGDKGDLPNSLPSFLIPNIEYTLQTLQNLLPYALAMAIVGLLESLLTAKLVDDITDTHSDKTREGIGQGIANVVTGFFGGMGGCAMIGQTMINVKTSGARTRLSTFLAGVFLLILVVGLGDLVSSIPMAALVAVMIMVSVGTFDWHSIKLQTLRHMPGSATAIMAITMLVTVLSHNLAYGVLVGVITAMVFFARRVAHFTDVERYETDVPDTCRYVIRGALFFASSNDLVYQFDYLNDPHNVVIDLSESQIYDSSTVASLDAIVHKYSKHGKKVEIVGVNPASQQWHRLSGHLGQGH
jgi:SulP family sulfate permease